MFLFKILYPEDGLLVFVPTHPRNQGQNCICHLLMVIPSYHTDTIINETTKMLQAKASEEQKGAAVRCICPGWRAMTAKCWLQGAKQKTERHRAEILRGAKQLQVSLH